MSNKVNLSEVPIVNAVCGEKLADWLLQHGHARIQDDHLIVNGPSYHRDANGRWVLCQVYNQYDKAAIMEPSEN